MTVQSVNKWLRRCVGLGAICALSAVIGAIYLHAQNPGSPAPTIPQTFFDANGDPLVSGTVSTYVTGTSTSAVTYSDAALNTRNSNPVTLNSAGRATIFLSATQVYRFIVSDSANVQMYSQDDIRPVGYTADQVAQNLDCHVRLTLTSGVPITTSSVTAATTIYATPYGGNSCFLYDGTNWSRLTFTETGLALGSDAANTDYDLFAYNAGGVLTLERLAFTNQYDRTTNLALQNGVVVRNGAPTRRWLGTYRTTATIGQTEDSLERRFVSNAYHCQPRQMRILEDAASWSGPLNNYRQANSKSSNQFAFVVGETRLIRATVRTHANNTTPGGGIAYLAIGDGTTTRAMAGGFAVTQGTTGITQSITANAEWYARVGNHTAVWLERAAGATTATFFGTDGNADLLQSGMFGEVCN